MADFTSTTHDVFIPEICSDESFMTYESNLVVAKAVLMTDEVGKGANKGDILRRPRISDVTAQDIPDNADITGEANTESQVTVTLNKKKHASVYIQKHLINNLSKYDLRQPYTHKIGYALGKRTDLDVIATLQAIGSPQTAGVADASATDVTEAFLKTAMEFLDVADIPMEDRSLVFYPDQRQAVLSIARFSEYQTMGPGNMPIRTGKVIPVFGMPTDFSTNLTQLGTTPHFYRAGYLLHKEAVWLAKPSEMDLEFNYIPRRKAWLLSGDLLYGSASYRGAANFVIVYTDN